jgi:alanine-glyoxylate transaminase/serine-glyoxylate transaminase/serine-pyruvate transaminase
LSLVPGRGELAANTLSAIYYPSGVGPELVASIGKRSVTVAGGLHPAIRTRYFRVGHMGHVLTRPDALRRTVHAVAEALAEHGHACDADAALQAFDSALASG